MTASKRLTVSKQNRLRVAEATQSLFLLRRVTVLTLSKISKVFAGGRNNSDLSC